MRFYQILFLIDLIFLFISILFTSRSIKEKEQHAYKVGFGSILFFIFLGILILLSPKYEILFAISLFDRATIPCFDSLIYGKNGV
ncbi:MAG: hypothetical protein JRI44_11110 [Deltaproteobacteria bacterium]|nr:hypothetical protein [Deltaproteobacteria bacterium]